MVQSISSNKSCEEEEEEEEKSILINILHTFKLSVLTGIIIFCVIALSFISVHIGHWNVIIVSQGNPQFINISQGSGLKNQIVRVQALGPFLPGDYIGETENFVRFLVILRRKNGTLNAASKIWRFPIALEEDEAGIEPVLVEHDFSLEGPEPNDQEYYQLVVSTDRTENEVSLSVDASFGPRPPVHEIIMAVCVLVGLYLLIIFDLVHRTLAAMIAAIASVACLAIVGERPSLEEVVRWLDVETLSLLFGMMILVSVLCETGFFDYVAVLAYKAAGGHLWSLITALCLATAVLSAFLDNVTTVLLLTPVTIRLCEAMNVDPKHILIALVVFCNVGGAATPIGDPPNVILVSDKKVMKAGIGFGNFTLHLLPAVILSLIGAYIFLRIAYRDVTSLRFADPPEVAELKREIEVWKKAYHSLSGYSRDEDAVRAVLSRKISVLETLLRKKLYDCKMSEGDYRASLNELGDAFKVKNTKLLLKSGIVIGVVILFFFLESIPQLNLSSGWIAVLGAICLLTLSDSRDMESILGRVEWSTLLFFASLFVLMEALSRLKLVISIVNLTGDAIGGVNESGRLTVAIVLILWISALSSSLVDNIPFTTVMVRVVTDLSEEMKLPLHPLIYALALGACFGGNGTLIGASANVVASGIADQHGYGFSFVEFFKIGFPIMLITTTLSTGYLLFCHVLFEWND